LWVCGWVGVVFYCSVLFSFFRSVVGVCVMFLFVFVLGFGWGGLGGGCGGGGQSLCFLRECSERVGWWRSGWVCGGVCKGGGGGWVVWWRAYGGVLFTACGRVCVGLLLAWFVVVCVFCRLLLFLSFCFSLTCVVALCSCWWCGGGGGWGWGEGGWRESGWGCWGRGGACFCGGCWWFCGFGFGWERG